MTEILAIQQYKQARLARDARFDGQFFVAVKTTQIFCRPICPANAPKEENVEYFQMAQQAMQAGYRPCLRCRPDSAPKSFAWKGVDTTVERGQKLLSQHMDISVQHIADKLGVTDRYFRQLFQRNLGLSPKQYQLFEQLLFAKQLLHQGSMSINDVALSCGFSSTRRLQDNLKRVTGLTPKQMKSGKTINNKTIRVELAFRPPYNWQHMRDFLQLRAIPELEQISADSYARTFTLEGTKGWFCAKYIPTKHHFSVTVELDTVTALKNVLLNIRRILDLDADIGIIDQQLETCGIGRENLISGLRIPGVWDVFEAGCRAILGQQISLKASINLVTQLTQQLGPNIAQRRYFPSPDAIANSDLSFLKIPQSRRTTLQTFSAYFAQSAAQDPDSWLALKGIGPWTVSYAKMRGLSVPDIWLGTDLVIKKQLEKHPVNADHARPWRSYLTLQLWSMA
ncbi:MAG: AraC family transcriptional regulator of adaptative response / DNA-3-methyladenine glycosylase II [Paraglaciecola sp.]|jgi:AraC family transcriptional regulator of adaptative response / DNA-3-methyladenine glycosylase II